MTVALKILVLLLMIAFSICLAAVEAAFYLLKRRRLSHVALHNRRAELVNRYLEDPPTLLMPVHMGTYTAHVAMTVVITSLLLGLKDHHDWALSGEGAAEDQGQVDHRQVLVPDLHLTGVDGIGREHGDGRA